METPTDNRINILHLEDSAGDAELTSALLEREGLDCNIVRVKSRAEFEAAILKGSFDVILSDFAVPQYNGLAALGFARNKSPLIPFILLSGTMGEELAVQSLRTGATDYILKEKPARLGEAIRRALEEARERAKRQEAEESLRKSEERFQFAARATNDVIWDWDLQTNEYWWSENFYTVFGYSPGDIPLGTEFRASRLHPDDKKKVLYGLNSLDQTAGGIWSDEYRFRRGDGTYANVLDRGYVIRKAGKAIRIIGAMMDMTERKNLEAQFLRSQRMECIGALAGGIAHDMNNMLAPILMAVDLLRESQSSENKEILGMVATSARRGAEMVKQILSFARGASGEHGITDVKQVVKDMARLAAETFPRSIRVECSVVPNLWNVIGNSTQLHQVLLNLCVNARDAMNGSGVLSIRAHNVTLEGETSRWMQEPASGPHVRLLVSDTGGGIPPEITGKLFDAFFTTKEAGKGTGLGLSTVMGIVKQHGGIIDVRSEVGKGTSFIVYLPASSKQLEARQEESEDSDGDGEEVLLIDDEVALLEMTRLMLEAHNYRVITATDGTAALRLYGQRRRSIRLVVTDLMMPIMDGSATIRALQKIDPDVKIIIISGLGSCAGDSNTSDPHVAAILKKPYSAGTLLRTIHQVLEMDAPVHLDPVYSHDAMQP